MPTGGRDVFDWVPVLTAPARRPASTSCARASRARPASIVLRATPRRSSDADYVAVLQRARAARERRGSARHPLRCAREPLERRLPRAGERLPAADRGRRDAAVGRAGGRDPAAAFGRPARSPRCCPRSCDACDGPSAPARCVPLAAAALLGLSARPAGAEGRLGDFTFRPSVNFAAVFDDNLFLTDSDEESSFGVWIRPRARARPIGPSPSISAPIWAPTCAATPTTTRSSPTSSGA